jgi:hypothetical protein
MTARGPAGADADEGGVVDIADEDRAAGHRLNLGMTPQTKIHIPLSQQLGVDRPMRAVADGAPFTQGRMFKHKRPSLRAMALAAGVVLTCHRQAAGRFEDVAAMRIMALVAAHLFLQQWMVLWQVKFCFGGTVAFKAGIGILAWIYDKLSTSAT